MRFEYEGKCRACGAPYVNRGNYKSYDTYRKQMEKRAGGFISDCSACKRTAFIDLVAIEARPAGSQQLVEDLPTAQVWEAYAIAYERRYGAPPIRNAAVNSTIKQFCQRLPPEEAPLVAAYYVTSNDRWFVQNGHPPRLLLLHAERLRTEAVTGNRITAAGAIQDDKGDARKQMWVNIIEELESDERRKDGT